MKFSYFVDKFKRGTELLPQLKYNSESGRRLTVAVSLLGVAGVILAAKDSKLWNFSRILLSLDNHGADKPWVVPGLRNLGNNCFLNVVLQALASCSNFRKFLENAMAQFEFSSIEERDQSMPLISALTSLMEDLCIVRREQVVLSPRKLMLAMAIYIPNFNLTCQQDAEEAFSHLLSALREELSDHYVHNNGSLADVMALPSSRLLIPEARKQETELQRWRQSFLGPFDGILGSTLTCQSCLFQISLEFQSFNSLHLSPPLSGNMTIKAGCSLEDCLKQFLMAEEVENYNCSNCWHTAAIKYVTLLIENKADIDILQRCNKEDSCDCRALSSLEAFPWSNRYTRALKQLSIARSPKILCLHVQRASVNVFGESIKFRGHISFPLILDLSAFLQSERGMKRHEENMQFVLSRNQNLQSSPQGDQNLQLDTEVLTRTACTRGSISLDEKVNSTTHPVRREHKYNLVAVVEHFGRDGDGHYTVYRKVRGKIVDEDPVALLGSAIEQWFCISDSQVHSVTEKDVLEAHASMLFYEQISES